MAVAAGTGTACSRSSSAQPANIEAEPAPALPARGARSAREPLAAPAAVAPFALVELFTSEGCSSCPPADRNLERIAERYEGRPVYTLSFHVDYWNHIGWRDPFSAPEYSTRQRRYSEQLGVRGVYTPQMVVNGTEEFVGSSRGIADASIERSLSSTPAYSVGARVTPTGDELGVAYRTDAPARTTRVTAAVAQRSAETSVRAGENSGRTLRHVNVVRAFHTASTEPSGEGTFSLELPEDLTTRDVQVVVWVEERQRPGVLAATAVDLRSSQGDESGP